jgi:hypothetical protein
MYRNVKMREVVCVPRVAAAPDHLTLRNRGALGDRRAVAGEMSVLDPLTLATVGLGLGLSRWRRAIYPRGVC